MSHHPHGSPVIELLLRLFLRRHRQALRLGCLAAVALAVLLLAGVAAFTIWGAPRLWRWVGQAIPEQSLSRSELNLPGLPRVKLPDLSALRIPAAWEQQLGATAFARIKAEARLLSAPSILEPLNRLAAPLLDRAVDAPYRFRFYVADSPEVNAYALPGGYIVFNRGLLERVRTPAEVQGVLAHEMAHVLRQHGVMKLAQDLGVDMAAMLLQEGENPLMDSLVRRGAELLTLRFSRDQERAADDLGWDLLEQARLDPRGMVSFFASLKADGEAPGSGLGLQGLLRTHPTPQERIDRLEQKAAALGDRRYPSFEAELQALKVGLRAQ